MRITATVVAAALLVAATTGTALAQEPQSVDRKAVQQAIDQLTSDGGVLGVRALPSWTRPNRCRTTDVSTSATN